MSIEGVPQTPTHEPEDITEESLYDIDEDEIEASKEMFQHQLVEAGLPPDATPEDLERAHLERHQHDMRSLAHALGLAADTSQEDINAEVKARGLGDKMDLPSLGLGFDASDEEIDDAREAEDAAHRKILMQVAREMRAHGFVVQKAFPKRPIQHESKEASDESALREETAYIADTITRGAGNPRKLIEEWERWSARMVASESSNERMRIFVNFQRVRLSLALGDVEDAIRRLESVIEEIDGLPHSNEMLDIRNNAEYHLVGQRNILEQRRREMGESKT